MESKSSYALFNAKVKAAVFLQYKIGKTKNSAITYRTTYCTSQ